MTEKSDCIPDEVKRRSSEKEYCKLPKSLKGSVRKLFVILVKYKSYFSLAWSSALHVWVCRLEKPCCYST